MSAWGALIMSFFGAVFAALTLALVWRVTGAALAPPVLVFAAIAAAALRVIRTPGDGVRLSPAAERAVTWSSVGEGVGLFLAGNLIMTMHRPDWLLPAMALVVGAHFLPIAAAARFLPFWLLGAALIAAAVAGFALGAPVGGAVAGFAAATALWLAAVMAVRRDARAKRGAAAGG